MGSSNNLPIPQKKSRIPPEQQLVKLASMFKEGTGWMRISKSLEFAINLILGEAPYSETILNALTIPIPRLDKLEDLSMKADSSIAGNVW
jgi:hypothetical protein